MENMNVTNTISEKMNATNTDAQKSTLALAMGVSVSAWDGLQIALTAIRATVGELDGAITRADVAANIAAKAIGERDAHWNDPDADRAALADAAKKATDNVAAAQADVADKKSLIDWQCKEWDKKSMEARIAYIADNGIADWIRLPKVYRIGVKTVKAGDETARIAYTRRVDLPLSQLPRKPIVDRMVCAIRADIRALYADDVAFKGKTAPVDRAGLPDAYAVTDPLSNGRLAKMLLAITAEYGMEIDSIHNGTARIYRDGAKTTTVKGITTERNVSALIDAIGYMAINIKDGTPFVWRVVED